MLTGWFESTAGKPNQWVKKSTEFFYDAYAKAYYEYHWYEKLGQKFDLKKVWKQ